MQSRCIFLGCNVSKYDGNTLISEISNGDHSHLSPGTSTLKPAACSTLMILATQQNYYKEGNIRGLCWKKKSQQENKWVSMGEKSN
jgi:hypothetical protein